MILRPCLASFPGICLSLVALTAHASVGAIPHPLGTPADHRLEAAAAVDGISRPEAQTSGRADRLTNPRPLWSRNIEMSGGSGLSMALGNDGFPVMAYIDDTGDVIVSKCVNKSCTKRTRTEIVGVPSFNTSIAIGADGNPVVASTDHLYQRLYSAVAASNPHKHLWDIRLTRCRTPDCTSYEQRSIHKYDWDGTPAYYPRIAVRPDGNPVVSIEEHWNLQTLLCSAPNCAPPYDRQYLSRGGEHDLTIAPDGLPLLVFNHDGGKYPHDSYGVTIVRCHNAQCSDHTLNSFDPIWPGRGASITVGSDGYPVVAYLLTTGLRVAHCTDLSCSTVTFQDVDPAGNRFGDPRPDTAIAINEDGNPVVAYYAYGPSVRVALCHDLDCSSAGITTRPGKGPSLALVVGPKRTIYLAYFKVPVNRLILQAFRY